MKLFIQNRLNQKLAVVHEGPDNAGKLAFVMHGLSGSKDEPHIRSIVQGFLENGFKVVSFDTTNTFGESDGAYEDATVTNYLHDLEDVVKWASTQPFYNEPFTLAAHSIGGLCTLIYAENNPAKVSAIAPISSVVNWELSLKTPASDPRQNHLAEWERDGVMTQKRSSGGYKTLKWQHAVDRANYDALTEAAKLKMPALLVVGSNDDATPPEHQEILKNALPGKKEMHIIEGAPHSFDNAPHEKEELYKIVKKWSAKLK